jgi:hypothetical protein
MCVGRVQTRLKLTDGQLALHHHCRYRDVVFFWNCKSADQDGCN